MSDYPILPSCGFTAEAFRIVIAVGKVPLTYEWADYEPTKHGRNFYPGTKRRVGHLVAFALCSNSVGEQAIKLFYRTARQAAQKWVLFAFGQVMQNVAAPADSEIVTL